MGNTASVVASLPKEQLIYEFATIYSQNPELWDSIIADIQAKKNPNADTVTEATATEENKKVVEIPRDDRVKGFTSEILYEINRVRRNPKEYAAVVQARADKFLDDQVYKLSSGEFLRTKEGKKAVLETVSFLNNLAPLPPMNGSPYLESAAMDHGSDISLNNVFSHNSSDGSTLKDRIERYCQWRGSLGENMDFSNNDPTEIIVNLLVDDGVPTRGHRKNILSPDYKFIGAALGPHTAYQHCCVIDFTCQVIGHDQILKKDMTRQLKSVADLEDEDVKKFILTVPYSGDFNAEFTEQLVNGAQVLIEYQCAQKSVKISFIQEKKTLTRSLQWS